MLSYIFNNIVHDIFHGENGIYFHNIFKEDEICLIVQLPLWVAGLTLSHTGVSLQTTTGKPGSTVMQNAPSTEGIAHIVGPHTPLSGLTPIVTPMTVVSQGNQVTAHILAPSSLAGKMITTPILKSVAQMPIVNAQYINTTTLVKPVVVVSSPSTSTPQSTTASSSTQPSSTTHSTVWQNQKKVKLAWEMASVLCIEARNCGDCGISVQMSMFCYYLTRLACIGSTAIHDRYNVLIMGDVKMADRISRN